MITDATGELLSAGDRIGTIFHSRHNPLVMVCEVKRLGAVMITGTVLSVRRTGEPVSEYASRVPAVGSETRLNAWRVFKLAPVALPVRELTLEELRIDVYQPGNTVRVTHLPTGSVVTMEGRTSVLEAKSDALEAMAAMVTSHEQINGRADG